MICLGFILLQDSSKSTLRHRYTPFLSVMPENPCRIRDYGHFICLETVELGVYCSMSDLLNLEVDLLYFDTTSSYFEVDPFDVPEEDTLRKPGFSKDKRPDLLQVVIGLAVTREGIPIRSWV